MRKFVTILLIVGACAVVLAFLFNSYANKKEMSEKMSAVRKGKANLTEDEKALAPEEGAENLNSSKDDKS